MLKWKKKDDKKEEIVRNILKRTLIVFVFNLLTSFCIMFAFSFDQTALAGGFVEVKDFENIVINSDTKDTKYIVEEMAGVDTDRSSGEIWYYKDQHRLSFREVKLFQIEDPLQFDEDGNNLPLIQINLDSTVLEFSIEILGENEIVNFGTTIEINCDGVPSNLIDVNIYGTSYANPNVLKINNKRCYNSRELPSILFNIPTNFTFTESENDYTVILSGVGGIEAKKYGESSRLILEAGSLFINVNSESVDYFIDDEKPLANQINIDFEEQEYNFAIVGFSQLISVKELPKDISYDEVNKCSVLSQGGVSMKTGEFYYGDFVYINNLSDLIYYLGLKRADQKKDFINLVLTSDIQVKFDKDYADLMFESKTDAFFKVNGRKRLFLNNHEIRGLYDEKKDLHPLFSLTYETELDIFGSHMDYPNGHGNRIIYAYSNSTTRYSKSIFLNNGGDAYLYGGVQIISIEDGDEELVKTGDISDYTINGNVFSMSSDGELNIYDADLWGGGGSLEKGDHYGGVVCCCHNYRSLINMYGGAIHSGNNEHENGFLVYVISAIQSNTTQGFKYYGGLLQSYGLLQKRLIYTSCYNKTFIVNPKAILRYENKTDALLNYDSSFVNGEPVLINSGYYQAGAFNELFDTDADVSSKIWGNYIRYGDQYYAPYIKDDLPDNIYVNGESRIQEFKITLFNPDNLYENTDDYTMGKHYSATLYIKNGDDVTVYSKTLGSDKFGLEPYKSLGLIYKDKIFTEYGVDYKWTDVNEPILVIKPTFPKMYDGLKVQIVIKNEYSNAVAYSNVSTIHVTQEIVEPVITLNGPKAAFSSEGYKLELGMPDENSKITARITNQYSNTIYVQWYDIGLNDEEVRPITGRLEYKMTHLDENDMYYQDVEFTPPTGSTALGLHGYKLYVWTYSKYGDNSYKITYSKTVKFNVGTSTPKIITDLPNQLNLSENELIDLIVLDDGTVPNVGYEWYYYPDYDYLTGIDQNNSLVKLGTLKPILTKDKALLQSNGNKNILTYDLFDKLELGKKYRIIFNEASDTLNGLVNVKLEYGDANHYVTPILESYNEINGNYEFNSEFSYLIVDRADMYLNPTYCKLVIEFADNVNSKATHLFTDFYLQEYDSENEIWMTVSNLNPYYYGLNYEGLYPLLENGVQIKTNEISTLPATLSMDGYYVYCKVYNTLDPTKYVYSNVTRLNVGLAAYQPEFTCPDYSIEFIGFGDTNELSVGVGEPIVGGNWVVEYSARAIIETVEKDIHGNDYIVKQSKSLSDMSDYGFAISFTTIPTGADAGKAHLNITLRPDAMDVANQLYNHHFIIEVTAYSPQDVSLTDKVQIDVMYDYPDEGFEISNIEFYTYNGGPYEYDMVSNSASKFYSNDGSYQIHDVLYLTSQSTVNLTAHRVNHYSNFDLDNDQKVFYEWKVKWLEEVSEGVFVPVDLSLEEFYNSELNKYTFIKFDNNHLSFKFLKSDNNGFDELKYHNLVIYCSMFNYENGYDMYTDYYQLSYVDLNNFEKPKLNMSDPALDPLTGDIVFNVTINTGIYNNTFWIDYDLNYKDLLAKDNEIYEVEANSEASGSVYISGLGYQENYFKDFGDGYYGVDWDYYDNEFSFNKTSSPYSYVKEIRISSEKLIEFVNKGVDIFADYSTIDNFVNLAYPEPLDTASMIENFGDNFKFLLDKIWDYYFTIDGYLAITLNNGIPAYKYEMTPVYYDHFDLMSIIYPCYYQDEFKKADYIEANLNEVKVIGSPSPLLEYYARYSWSVYNPYLDDTQYLVVDSDDCYLELDTSKFFVDKVYILETTLSSTADFIEGTYYTYRTVYYVKMAPNIVAPTMNGLGNKTYQLYDPEAYIEAEFINNDPVHQSLYYDFYIEGMNYGWKNSEDSIVALKPTELGDYTYKFILTIVYTYVDEYGEEKEYSKDFISDEYVITVTERVVDSVDIIGIEAPIALEHPMVEGIQRGEILPGDEFFGYKISAKYWNISGEDYFEYDKNYTLSVLIESIDGAYFTDSITAKFNSKYNANVEKLSDTQFLLTYSFTSSVSTSINNIELSLPNYEALGVIRPLDIIETDYCALHDFSFNTNDTNFEYGKVYTLTAIFRVYSQYHLEDNAKVIINGKEHNYEYQNGLIIINYEYYFPYSVKVVIGEKEEVLETDNDNKINLSLLDSDIPNGKVFNGWYKGEELISNDASSIYEVNANGIIIDAKFIDIIHINEVNIGENDFKVESSIPVLPALVYDGYTVNFEINTTDLKFGYLKTYVLKATINPKFAYDFSDNVKVYSGSKEIQFSKENGIITAEVEYFFYYYAKYDLSDNDVKTIYSDKDGKISLTAPETYQDRPLLGWYLIGGSGNTLITTDKTLNVTLTTSGNYYRPLYKEYKVINEINLPSLPEIEVGKDAINKDEELTDYNYSVKVILGNDKVTGKIEYLKEYKLLVTITKNDDTILNNNAVIKINGVTVSGTYNQENGSFSYTTDGVIFYYEATINIMDKQNKVNSNIKGEINLDIESVPEGKVFNGWFKGKELISKELHYVYTLTENGITIDALFADEVIEIPTPPIKDGNYVIEGNNDDIKDVIDQAKDDDKGLEIEGSDATVIFDKDTVKELANNEVVTLLILTGAEYATGDIEKANLSNVKLVLEISLDNIPNNLNAKIKVPVNFEVKEGEVVKVFYVNENGIIENMNAQYENGIVSFSTTHFSTYVITLDKKESDVPTDNPPIDNPDEEKNNSWIIILIIVLVVLIGGGLAAFFILKKKNDNNHDDDNHDDNNDNENIETAETENKDVEGVIFKEKKSLNEEYANLTKADRKLYDTIKAKALGFDGVRTTEAIDSYTVYLGKDKLIRLKIKSGKIIVEFFANDSGLKEIVGGGSKDVATNIKVTNEEECAKAIEALNYKYNILSKKE